jgi:methionine synthase I (cobalamin-dependent)
MGKLADLLETEKRIIISGLYGTETAERVGRLAQQYNICIVGGCCGTNQITMTEIFRVLTS